MPSNTGSLINGDDREPDVSLPQKMKTWGNCRSWMMICRACCLLSLIHEIVLGSPPSRDDEGQRTWTKRRRTVRKFRRSSGTEN